MFGFKLPVAGCAFFKNVCQAELFLKWLIGEGLIGEWLIGGMVLFGSQFSVHSGAVIASGTR